MNAKLIAGILLMLIIIGCPAFAEAVEITIEYEVQATLTETIYRGRTLTLPQITATKILDEDNSDGHLLYLYGTYQIESDSQPLTQIHSSTYPNPAITHTFSNTGNFNYTAVVMYAEMQFNYTTSNWDLINSGVDNSTTVNYNVTSIPAPPAGFFTNLLNYLRQLLCSAFPWLPFC